MNWSSLETLFPSIHLVLAGDNEVAVQYNSTMPGIIAMYHLVAYFTI